MITIVLIGAVAAVAMFAILLKLSPVEHKKAEKLEKGDVIKQLLALSELEERSLRTKAPIPHRPSGVDKPAQTPSSSPTKAVGRTSCAT
jgi:hypothetical protein